MSQDEHVDWLDEISSLRAELATVKAALRLVVQVGENVLKPKFDHCGAMNATQLMDRDCVLNMLKRAQAILKEAGDA